MGIAFGFWHRIIILFAALAVLFLFRCPSVRAASPQDPDPPYVFRGYLSAKYVYRTVVLPDRRDKDQDIFSELRLDLTPAREKGYEFHFLGSGRVDIDGPQKRSGFVPLEDIGNTYSRRAQGYIYEAHLDLDKPVPALSQVRLGRQTSTRDEPVIFDGMALDFSGDAVALSLYGGSAVHLFEIDHRWGHDTLQGAGLDLMPFSLTTLSLDVLAVKDEREFIPDGATVRDRQFAIKLRQRIPPLTRLTAKYRTMNDEPRDLSVQAATTWQEAEAELAVNYFRQFRTQGELSNEFSLFFDVIGQSAPYQSYDVKARKFIAEKFAVDAGYFKRTLLDAGDKGPFDREFSRAYFDVEYSGCILAGLSCTVVTEWWQSGERKFSTGGLDLAYSLRRKNGKEAKIGAGTYYSLYKYDYYIDIGARELVRTYYLNGRYPFTATVSLNGSYEFEHGIENYQTVKTGIRYDF